MAAVGDVTSLTVVIENGTVNVPTVRLTLTVVDASADDLPRTLICCPLTMVPAVVVKGSLPMAYSPLAMLTATGILIPVMVTTAD